MSARHFKPAKSVERRELDAANDELMDELAALLPANNPVVVKRKGLLAKRPAAKKGRKAK